MCWFQGSPSGHPQPLAEFETILKDMNIIRFMLLLPHPSPEKKDKLGSSKTKVLGKFSWLNVLGKYYSPCKFFRCSQLVPVMSRLKCQIVLPVVLLTFRGQCMPVKCLKSLR